MNLQIINGDSREQLKTLPESSVQCVVTSPPYFGLRDYNHDRQIGLENSPSEYVDVMLEIFREVWRVLKPDGTIWLNLGDSYARSGKGGNPENSKFQKQATNQGSIVRNKRGGNRWGGGNNPSGNGVKPKDLIGIPWRVAFALQDAGWYLRSDIIWSKSNCMPESVTDRPTRSHEYIFLMTKSAHYFYDHEAIKEPCVYGIDGTGTADEKSKSDDKNGGHKQRGHARTHSGFNNRWDDMTKFEQCSGTRNKRDVWTVPTSNLSGAHFATFPTALIKPCILAGTRHGDTVLDPFFGSGTTGMVAVQLGRNAIGIDINNDYCDLAKYRCNVTPGLKF